MVAGTLRQVGGVTVVAAAGVARAVSTRRRVRSAARRCMASSFYCGHDLVVPLGKDHNAPAGRDESTLGREFTIGVARMEIAERSSDFAFRESLSMPIDAEGGGGDDEITPFHQTDDGAAEGEAIERNGHGETVEGGGTAIDSESDEEFGVGQFDRDECKLDGEFEADGRRREEEIHGS
jgi:hypothetical protein